MHVPKTAPHHHKPTARTLRLARVFARAVQLYEGDEAEARLWLSETNPALGGRAPMEMLDSEHGAALVEHLIGRLEHGVHS